MHHLYIKTIILPRQARDKHRKRKEKRAFFRTALGQGSFGAHIFEQIDQVISVEVGGLAAKARGQVREADHLDAVRGDVELSGPSVLAVAWPRRRFAPCVGESACPRGLIVPAPYPILV